MTTNAFGKPSILKLRPNHCFYVENEEIVDRSIAESSMDEDSLAESHDRTSSSRRRSGTGRRHAKELVGIWIKAYKLIGVITSAIAWQKIATSKRICRFHDAAEKVDFPVVIESSMKRPRRRNVAGWLKSFKVARGRECSESVGEFLIILATAKNVKSLIKDDGCGVVITGRDVT